ncbi:kinase-like protein [Hyaloscypha variabilis F]|uniref:non-specific serine/threonine protein kinase n=1 Tax=Hyaloscypha variabilis (strain UAMH 11265 / GT02V1 / F) TaxID=1149755 RepID=A0A2J6R7C0_HYAVF|nr:kinase-like protein [Hyaloscypha variabilis F]
MHISASYPHVKRDEDEEGISRYVPGDLHPVSLGELYNNKYLVLRKLGYGRYSTVWLVQDTSAKLLWAMKVLSASCYGTESDIFELEILQHLKSGDVTHPGYQYSILHDSFTHKGPNGEHVCLIFKLMGESLRTFREWFDGRIPTHLVQKFTRQLLHALEYAHGRGVIHTEDIQPSNIMIQIPDESLLTPHISIPNILPDTSSSPPREYKIIQTHSLREIYFAEDFNVMDLNITLSDWGVASFVSHHMSEEIQPLLLRAPEVLFGAKWDEKVDIWNLGALVPELVFGQRMFCARDERGAYSVGRHLEEMVGLLGAMPGCLLEKGDREVVIEWFGEDGELRGRGLEKVVSLEKRFEGMDLRERGKFLAFVRKMLVLDPGKRLTARELLGEDWLKHDYDADVPEEN